MKEAVLQGLPVVEEAVKEAVLQGLPVVVENKAGNVTISRLVQGSTPFQHFNTN